MDYEADKLVTGALQIGNGTHLFVEEADISEEKLRNLQKNTQGNSQFVYSSCSLPAYVLLWSRRLVL